MFSGTSWFSLLNGSKTTANTFIEDEIFADYLEARIKEDLLTLLTRQPKVAFDPDGIELIESTVRATIIGIALCQGRNNCKSRPNKRRRVGIIRRWNLQVYCFCANAEC